MTRVLVVDDNEDNLYLLEVLLRANNYEVDLARHGADALLKAKNTLPDIVISDLLMPVMDGYTLLSRWKADPALKEVPFVVHTATYTEPEDERLAFSMGADGFILKPCEPDEFLEMLKAAQDGDVRSRPTSIREPVSGTDQQLREYSETLIRKLEQRTLQLEESNRRLEEDIRARQKVETALRESEERFRQLAESVDDVFWLTDTRESRIIYISPRFEKVWGHSPEKLYDSPRLWLDFVHPKDREHVASSLPKYASGSWDETFRIVRSDGEERWIRSRAFPVLDRAGRTYRVAGVSRDVTQYRDLEEQFRQAQKMEAIGRLAGGVAHDFNNLLAVILTYANFARSAAEPGTQLHADVEEVHRAGKRAAALTRQLLAFSRQQMFEPQVLGLAELLRGLEPMLRRLLSEDIDFNLDATKSDPEEGGCNVLADPTQIEQIVMNLVVNAGDAMPQGGTLTVKLAPFEFTEADAQTHPGLKPGCYAELTVTDTGVGMDDSVRAKIFEPFFTTKEVGQGTGLGLSTVFGIVQQNHGHISVKSEPGRGTTFKVYLPSTDRPRQNQQVFTIPPDTYRGSETVLLVEDDDQVRKAHEAILSRHGYRVIPARNGVEALTFADVYDDPIHILLTDVVMPKMGGFELAALLLESRPQISILYVSGYSKSAAAWPSAAGTVSAFLQKPASAEALLGKLREMLDTSQEAHASTPPQDSQG
jgi:two-component system cell cycle sensor histidine kinase/response regulator CckA